MTEEKDQAVNEETQAPVGEENESNEGVGTQVAAEEAKPDDQEINWQRANEKMREQSQEIRALRSELAQVREHTSPKKEEPKFGGRDPDDIPTFQDVDQYWSKKEAELNQKLAMLEAKSRYPDFDNTLEKYGKLLPESAKMAILHAPNPHMAAYEMCQILAEQDKIKNTIHSDAKRVKDNLNKVGSASAVGNTGTLSEAKKWENMSLEDVLAHSQKVLNG